MGGIGGASPYLQKLLNIGGAAAASGAGTLAVEALNDVRAEAPVDWKQHGWEAAGSAGGTALTGLIGAVKDAGKLAEAQKEYTAGKRYNEALKKYGLKPLGKDWSSEDSALEIASRIYSGRMTAEDVQKIFEAAGGYDVATGAYLSEMPGWKPGAAKDSAPAGERGVSGFPAFTAVPPLMPQAPVGQALPPGGEFLKALQAGTQQAAVSGRAMPMPEKIQQEESIAVGESINLLFPGIQGKNRLVRCIT